MILQMPRARLVGVFVRITLSGVNEPVKVASEGLWKLFQPYPSSGGFGAGNGAGGELMGTFQGGRDPPRRRGVNPAGNGLGQGFHEVLRLFQPVPENLPNDQ